MVSQQEKRRFRRQQTAFDVRIERASPSSKDFSLDICVGQTVDMSAGGMYFKLKEFIDVDEVVGLQFVTPNTFDIFHGTARVVRTAKNADQTYSVALEFLEISEEQRSVIDYHLHRV